MSVFMLFVLALTAGTLSTLFWIPEEDLGRGYFQLNALIVLGLLALTIAIVVLHPIEVFEPGERAGPWFLGVAAIASFLYYAVVWMERWRWVRIPALVALLAVTGALLLAGSWLITPRTPLPYREPLTTLDLLSSSMLLGWSLIPKAPRFPG